MIHLKGYKMKPKSKCLASSEEMNTFFVLTVFLVTQLVPAGCCPGFSNPVPAPTTPKQTTVEMTTKPKTTTAKTTTTLPTSTTTMASTTFFDQRQTPPLPEPVPSDCGHSRYYGDLSAGIVGGVTVTRRRQFPWSVSIFL